MLRPSRNSSRVRGTPTVSMNFCSPVCEYTSPSLAGRHPELYGAGGDSQIAADRQLESQRDRVDRRAGDGRVRERLERLDRRREGVRDELLGLRREDVVGNVADVVAGPENMPADPVRTRAANLPRRREGAGRRGDRVEDRVIGAGFALLRGMAIVSRATCGAGRSSWSLPSASACELAEDNERVALVDGLTLLASISWTVPPSSASTGQSPSSSTREFRTVSPSSISSPTATSIFHTVPVMCASTSAGGAPRRAQGG